MESKDAISFYFFDIKHFILAKMVEMLERETVADQQKEPLKNIGDLDAWLKDRELIQKICTEFL
jgi:hypothetical protein